MFKLAPARLRTVATGHGPVSNSVIYGMSGPWSFNIRNDGPETHYRELEARRDTRNFLNTLNIPFKEK